MADDTLKYNTGQLRNGGQGVRDAGDDLTSRYQALMAEVGDMSAFGSGHDTVGSLAQMVYQAVVERVTETVDGSSGAYADFGDKLKLAADIYDRGEQDNATIAQSSIAQNSSAKGGR